MPLPTLDFDLADQLGKRIAEHCLRSSGGKADDPRQIISVAGCGRRPIPADIKGKICLPVFIEDLRLFMGPLFGVNTATCGQCWFNLLDRISGVPHLSRFRSSYYQRTGSSGPTGLLASQEVFLAAQIMQILEGVPYDRLSSTMFVTDMITFDSYTLGLDCDCVNAESSGPSPHDLFNGELSQALRALSKDESGAHGQ